VAGSEGVTSGVAVIVGPGGLSLEFEHAVTTSLIESARNNSRKALLIPRTLLTFAHTRITSPKHHIGDSG